MQFSITAMPSRITEMVSIILTVADFRVDYIFKMLISGTNASPLATLAVPLS
ncbi:MAG: hypothetical protein IPQ04_15300 [Saprospiraceae bacterium]|nr:hypothetical protein [Saprospiraceae bacterium]